MSRCDWLVLKGWRTHPLTQKNTMTQQFWLQSLNQIATCTLGCGVYIILCYIKKYRHSCDDCHLFWALLLTAPSPEWLQVPAAEETLSFIVTELMEVELVRNLMAHAQKPGFVFRLSGRVHLKRRGSHAEYTTSRGRVRVLATHSICRFPLHFRTRASPCAITFRTQYTLPST